MRTPSAVACALILSILLKPVLVDAIVIRHDRDDRSYLDLAKKYPATVTLHHAGSGFPMDGMGTLIAPRWVLTAGHVAVELAPGDLAEIGGSNYKIEAIVQYPGWRGMTTWEDVRRDIALLRLETAVTGVEPAKLYTGDGEVGMTATFVGRGRRGTGLTGPVADDNLMRAATNRVHAVDGTQLVFRFDSPGEAGVTSLEGISGDGDSGGPAYAEIDGVLHIIGVGSAQDSRPANKKLGHYGVLELYPRVSSFAGWIRATIGDDAS